MNRASFLWATTALALVTVSACGPGSESSSNRTRNAALGTISPVTTVAGEELASTNPTSWISRPTTPYTYVIVGMGDSFGSGEGNPAKKKPLADPDAWQGTRWWNADGTTDPEAAADCHRSSKSGFYKAVRRLKEKYPYFEFTYKNFACTGAVISELWNTPQIPGTRQNTQTINGWSANTEYDPQLDQVDAWMRSLFPNRTTARIDSVYLSIGGNDAGFADAIKHCVKFVCTLTNGKIQELHRSITSGLDDSYGVLKDKMHHSERYATPVAVVISEYPNFIKNEHNEWCQSDDAPLGMVSSAEWEYLWNQIGVPLLRTINDFASANNWQVAQMEDRYKLHVLCDSNTYENAWVNNDEFAGLNQGNDDADNSTGMFSMGMVHPNNPGYEAYADAIEPQLIKQLVESSAAPGNVRDFRVTRISSTRNSAGQVQMKFSWTPPRVSGVGRKNLSGYRIFMKQPSSYAGSQTLDVGLGNTITTWVNPENLVFTIAPCGQSVDSIGTRGCGITTEFKLLAGPTAGSSIAPFAATSTLPPSAYSSSTAVSRP